MNKKRQTIALCMLVCNEEKVLGRSIESAEGLFDELIIVDTGSTDRSIAIARNYDADVIEIKWKDDFAWARNQGLELAKSDWIFILDPDEIISKIDIPKLRELTEKEGVMVYQIPTRNYTDNSFVSNFVPNKGEYEEEKGYRGYVASVKTRLFRNHIGLKFEGVVHEMIDYMAFRQKLNGMTVNIPIHHKPGEKARRVGKSKALFMTSICEKKVEQNPTDGQAWWELGAVQHSLGLEQSAFKSMKHALSLGHKKPENYFIVAMVAKNIKEEELSKRYFEKAVCLMNPELTHVKKQYKELDL